ncbi:MAG: response regulator [Myxococcales bacterium]|nr:response regulator [Myxococcales bacterium]
MSSRFPALAAHDAVRDKLDEAERGIAAVRFALVVTGFVLYPFVTGRVGDRPWLAWSLLGCALIYGGATLRWRVIRERTRIESALATSLIDSSFTMLWLYATGGFDSPFFFAIYIAVISVAIRFTARETFAAAGLYCVAYLVLAEVSGVLGLARLGDIVIRSTYLFVAAAAGALISSQLLAMANARIAAQRAAEAERVKERLYEAERLAALGTLAGGVGHEINNPLTWVSANIELVRDELGDDASPTLREALRDLEDGTSRIAAIVKDLKVFTRADERRRAVDVIAPLRTAMKMAGNEIRHRAQLVTELRPVPRVMADEGRLGQVFLNLLVNAAQAMSAGRAGEDELRVCTREGSEGEVIVEISDTGPGIPPEVAERAFEPFFTTKPLGEGTGLGLAISHRIVTTLGGRLELDSEPGRGTTARVVLPAAEGPVVAEETNELEPVSVRLRVLVVDDEPMLLRAVTRMLSVDAEVAAESTGAGALARVRAGEAFDVVLCDLLMPEMSGMELHAALEREAPELARRTLFMTGGAFTDDARAFLARDDVQWLEKPLRAKPVRRLLRRLADGEDLRASA